MRDPVVTMFGMTSMVPVEMIPHMDQFLGDDDLDGTAPGDIDPVEIDQDGMNTAIAQEAIRPAI